MSNAIVMAQSFDLQAELTRLRRENAYLQQRVRELEKAQSDTGWELEAQSRKYSERANEWGEFS